MVTPSEIWSVAYPIPISTACVDATADANGVYCQIPEDQRGNGVLVTLATTQGLEPLGLGS